MVVASSLLPFILKLLFFLIFQVNLKWNDAWKNIYSLPLLPDYHLIMILECPFIRLPFYIFILILNRQKEDVYLFKLNKTRWFCELNLKFQKWWCQLYLLFWQNSKSWEAVSRIYKYCVVIWTGPKHISFHGKYFCLKNGIPIRNLI